MAREYVFWRDATGKHCPRDKDHKWAPQNLLTDIATTASVNEEGNLTWQVKSLDLFKFKAAIRARVAIRGPDQQYLNETDAWSIVKTAMESLIKMAGGGSSISAANLLLEADKKAAAFYRKSPKRYVFVTSLSIDSFPATQIRILGQEVRPLKTRRRYPYPERCGGGSGTKQLKAHLTSSSYQLVRVCVTGRSVHDAVHRGLEAVNYLRSLWNLFATYRQVTVWSDSPRPLAAIHIGPVHTLHEPTGLLAAPEGAYWYEPDYTQDHRQFTPHAGWKKLEELRRWATRKIKGLPYESELVQLLGRYGTALDSPNLNTAYLHLWGILEKITNTIGSRYETTIKRAVRLYGDRHIARELLEAVRLRRNQYVHSADVGRREDQIAYIVKGFLDPHLLRLIRNDFGIDRLDEYGTCLDMPVNEATLLKTQRWARKLLKMQRSG